MSTFFCTVCSQSNAKLIYCELNFTSQNTYYLFFSFPAVADDNRGAKNAILIFPKQSPKNSVYCIYGKAMS